MMSLSTGSLSFVRDNMKSPYKVAFLPKSTRNAAPIGGASLILPKGNTPERQAAAHHIFATTPSWVLAQPALPEVCREVVALAEMHFTAAGDAITFCRRHRIRPAGVMLGVYRAILRELIARGWRNLDKPVHIPAWRKLGIALRHGVTGR
jgi:hypothetical protein